MPDAFITCKGTGFLGGSNPPLHGHSLTAPFTHEGVPVNMPLLDIALLYKKIVRKGGKRGLREGSKAEVRQQQHCEPFQSQQ